jgi:ATP-dependent protease ClpP protease subunit
LVDPNKDFRPDPTRGVYVQGTIDQQMVYRLTPRILTLQGVRRPITVYIDSPGGNLANMESIWRLLTASNQDASPPCRVITVVTVRAASAAADLLSSGDYAIAASPQSTILFHGSRTFGELPLTVQTTSVLAQFLRMTNENYAMELIRKIEGRFMFRFLVSKKQFGEVRRKHAKEMTDSECFLSIISESLSERARKLFLTARERQGRYDQLLKKAKAQRVSKRSRIAKVEAARIKAILDFEVEENRGDKSFSFQGGGITRLTDDFYLLNEYLAGSQSDRLDNLCRQWGRFALDAADQAQIEAAPEADRAHLLVEKVRPRLEPLWSFFVALCHALQEGENELSATDALWLGLIDEVVGVPDLIWFRQVAEYQPDPSEPPAPAPEAAPAPAPEAAPAPAPEAPARSPAA